MSAFIEINILALFFMVIGLVVGPLIPIIFIVVEHRFFMGTLGKVEYRNQRGIAAVIESPEGFVGIERARFRFPGLLMSLNTPPRFGKYFFVGEDAVLKPVGAIRLAFIDGRSSVGAAAHTIATVEAVRGNYVSNSAAISEALDKKADDAQEAAKKAADDLQRKNPGMKIVARLPALNPFRHKGRPARPVPQVKSYEELALHWAATRYYPLLEYTRRVQPMDPAARAALKLKDPAAYALWRQSYIEDQLQALLFYANKDNEMSIMNEIKNPGILRKTRVLETYKMDADDLTVLPQWTTVQESRPLPKEQRVAWFVGVTKDFAKDPESWPVEIGGRAVEVRALADFKLSMLGQGQVHDMLANEHDIATDEQDRRDTHIIKLAMAVMLILLGAGAFLYLLVHG